MNPQSTIWPDASVVITIEETVVTRLNCRIDPPTPPPPLRKRSPRRQRPIVILNREDPA